MIPTTFALQVRYLSHIKVSCVSYNKAVYEKWNNEAVEIAKRKDESLGSSPVGLVYRSVWKENRKKRP